MGAFFFTMTQKTFIGEPHLYNPNYHRFADFLGVDRYKRDNFNLAKKISFIYGWAQTKLGRDDPDTIMKVIHEFQRGLGVNYKGRTLVNELYKNIRLNDTGPTPIKVHKASLPEKKKEKKVEQDQVAQSVEKRMKPITKKIEKEVKIRVKTAIDESIGKAIGEVLK